MAHGAIIHGADSGDLTAIRFPTSAAPAVMKITAIKQQVKRAGRYSVFVNEKYAFSLSEGTLLDQKIYIGLEVTPQQLEVYKDTAELDKAYSLTLAYVARRLRSEWELRDYFRRKDIDEDAGEQILTRLQGFGYVSDLAFARSWVDNRRAIKSVSRRRLIQELRQKHVTDEVVHQVLQEDETSDLDTLKQLIEKKRKQTRYQDSQKLMQYLARQGYGYDDIKRVLADNYDA
jgi:regulatory protein